jgi:hypothetical protein
MAEIDIEFDNIYAQMEGFLRSQARREPAPTHPLYLRTEYKNGLKLTDKEKHQFNV